jgi:hypothetical protein
MSDFAGEDSAREGDGNASINAQFRDYVAPLGPSQTQSPDEFSLPVSSNYDQSTPYNYPTFAFPQSFEFEPVGHHFPYMYGQESSAFQTSVSSNLDTHRSMQLTAE